MHSTSACEPARFCHGDSSSGGTALYFALFCDVAGRDEQTIEAFWASIARFWGARYRRQDYYQQINQLRGVMGKAPANGLSEAHAVGVYSRVAVFQDESGQKGHSQVLLTLRTENTQALSRQASSISLSCRSVMVTFWCLIRAMAPPLFFSTMYSAWGSASGKEPAPCTATLWRTPGSGLPRH